MREKLVSIGDDFWIENESGQKAFKVDGKALRVRQTLKMEATQNKLRNMIIQLTLTPNIRPARSPSEPFL
jgi:uncharacterized protein YxjI